MTPAAPFSRGQTSHRQSVTVWNPTDPVSTQLGRWTLGLWPRQGDRCPSKRPPTQGHGHMQSFEDGSMGEAVSGKGGGYRDPGTLSCTSLSLEAGVCGPGSILSPFPQPPRGLHGDPLNAEQVPPEGSLSIQRKPAHQAAPCGLQSPGPHVRRAWPCVWAPSSFIMRRSPWRCVRLCPLEASCAH